jgi:hypothetical protein
MEAIREVQKRYCSAALAVAVPLALSFVFVGMKPAGKGLVLGALFSILNFVLMGQALPLRLGRTRTASIAVSFGSLGFRYLLLAIPLIVALRVESFHPVTTVFGIFMIQIVILADHFAKAFRRRHEKRA